MSSVVVTGAAGGIGSATCALLLERGYTVVGVDRDGDALARVPGIIAVVGDVTDPETAAAARRAAEDAGSLTAWVNNAAVLRPTSLHEASPSFIHEQLGVNLVSVLLGCAQALGSFVEHDVAGAIVNVTSIHAQHPFPFLPLYATAKGGVEALTRQLCVEYGERGIRVNAVAPGAVNTAMTRGDGDAQAALASAALLSPMRRVSEPTEIAAAIAFLLSPEAAGINGHVLAVDNGMSAQGGQRA